MQEQLELNKELTQKLVVPSDSEDEGKEDEDASALPDFVNEPESPGGSVNPWMRGKLTSEGHEVTPDVTPTEELASSQKQEEEQPEEEEEVGDEEEQLLRHFEMKRKLRQDEEDGLVPVVTRDEEGGTYSPARRDARLISVLTPGGRGQSFEGGVICLRNLLALHCAPADQALVK